MSIRERFSELQGLGSLGEAESQLNFDRVCAELDRMAARIRLLARTGKPQSTSDVMRAGVTEALIRVRSLRRNFFDADLFADAAWDLLLDLKRAEFNHAEVSVSSACIAARVPTTTALRWVSAMVDRGLLVRTADESDGRRVHLSLEATTSVAMDNYLDAAAKELGVLETFR